MPSAIRVSKADLKLIPKKGTVYWALIRHRAECLGSDGCTGVPDFYLEACLEHDIHWRTGRTLYGQTISTRQSNTRFRWVIQDRSLFGVFSPLSWWRWAAVSIAGRWHRMRRKR